jgi:hypothetical protein
MTAIQYQLYRSVPRKPWNWINKTKVWMDLLRPLPAIPEQLEEKDYVRVFAALARIFGKTESDFEIVVQKRVEDVLTWHSDLATISKDLFCRGGISDIQICGASLRSFQDAQKPKHCRLTGSEPKEIVLRDNWNKLGGVISYAVKSIPAVRLDKTLWQNAKMQFWGIVLEAQAYALLRHRDIKECAPHYGKRPALRWPLLSLPLFRVLAELQGN